MAIDWNKLAQDAANTTDEQFKNQLSSLTRLNDQEIAHLIEETGISKANLALVLKEVKDASKSNEQKASAIKNIANGVNVLIDLAVKFV